MTKEKINITNKNDGEGEIRLEGDIWGWNAEYIADQIVNYKGKVINMRINSHGGSVMAAYSIISAMNSFYEKGGIIKTINEGRADSCAGWILAFGTRGYRQILQFAGMFFHQPAMEVDGEIVKITDLAEGSGDRKMLEKIYQDLIDIFCASCSITESRVRNIMDNDTDMNAQDAVNSGFADKMVRISNMPSVSNSATRAQLCNFYKVYNYKVAENNSTKQNKRKMKEVAKFLNLCEDAAEESVLNAVKKLKLQAEKATELEARNKSLSKDLETLKTSEIKNYVDSVIEADKSKEDQREDLINAAKGMSLEAFKNLFPVSQKVVNGPDISDGISENENSKRNEGGDKDIEKKAKEFFNMPENEKRKLKDSDYDKYTELCNAYQKHYIG